MKKVFFALVAGAMMLVGCQKQAQVAETVYSVDDVYAQGDSLTGDTILVEGMCLHLCKHGGKKAFLRSSEDGEFIRANAVAFESFAPECVNNKVRVKGVLQMMEVPVEPAAEAAEEQHHEGEEACGICSTVRKYYLDAVDYSIINDENEDEDLEVLMLTH